MDDDGSPEVSAGPAAVVARGPADRALRVQVLALARAERQHLAEDVPRARGPEEARRRRGIVRDVQGEATDQGPVCAIELDRGSKTLPRQLRLPPEAKRPVRIRPAPGRAPERREGVADGRPAISGELRVGKRVDLTERERASEALSACGWPAACDAYSPSINSRLAVSP